MFPRQPVRRVRDDRRSARRVKSGPRPADHGRDGSPGGRGGTGKEERPCWLGRVARWGGPVPPEGGGRTRRGTGAVADGTPRRRRPGAGWPPARDRRHNPAPSPQDKPPPPRAGTAPDTRPRSAGRYGFPVPAPVNKGDGPGPPLDMGRAPRRGTVVRTRASRATVAVLALVLACALPRGRVPACRQRAALPKRFVMGGLAPCAAALSATTEIGFSGPFFTRSRKIGSCEIDIGGWLLQRSSPGPHAGAGCLTYCFAAQDPYSAGWGFKAPSRRTSERAVITNWRWTMDERELTEFEDALRACVRCFRHASWPRRINVNARSAAWNHDRYRRRS